MSRALMAAGIISLCAAASPAVAQTPAIDQRVPLKLYSATEEAVFLVQIPARGRAPQGATFDGWVWTFVPGPQDDASGRWNTVAVLTRFDCRAGTRQRLRYEFYLDESPVSSSAPPDAPAVPTPGTNAEGALRTVCDPTHLPDNLVVDGARGLRATADQYFAGG